MVDLPQFLCHCFRKALLFEWCGSRSHAWRFRFVRFLWGIWLKAVLTGWARRPGLVVSDSTWSLGPKTKACWATLEQSEWFFCMGSPATSPPLCPRWLLMGRHMHPEPPMADLVPPLLWSGNLVPEIQRQLVVESVAHRSIWGQCHLLHILLGRPPEGETTI